MNKTDLSKLVIYNINSAVNLKHSPINITTVRKDRECWAVVYKREGRTVYHFDGEDIISDKLHPVILPKGCTYSWTCTSGGECLMVEFDCNLAYDRIMQFTIKDGHEISKSFYMIEKNRTADNTVAQFHALYGIMNCLVESQNDGYIPSTVEKKLKPAIDYITVHYDNYEITNDFLASLCGVSTVYFRKMFLAKFGKSPISYLSQLRIEKAKELLSSDYASISQIAECVGYSSIYHFSKMFKKYTGISPRQFGAKIDTLS